MNINPEFRRNLWLELSPLRLIGMPLVLGAIFLFAFVVDGKHLDKGVANTALFLFGLLPIIWGTKLAGESVVTEIRDRTWDGQRMSVIGPWAMTWGKLFGSTVFPWYGAALCLIVYIVSIPLGFDWELTRVVLLIAGSALAGQTVALFASLLSIRKDRRFSRSQAAAFSMLGIITAVLILSFALQTDGPLDWFGKRYHPIDFALISLALFFCWALAGVHQLMRLELQMKNPPWVWLGFVLFAMAFTAGFSFDSTNGMAIGLASRSLFPAYVVGVVLVYAAAFAEPKDPMRLRRLIHARNVRAWEAFLRSWPSWVMALPLLIAVATVLILVPPENAFRASNQFRIALMAAQFFILRDLALLVFFNLSKKRKRADMLAILWLVMLWLVIPLILSGLGFGRLAALFHPRPDSHPLTSLIAAPCAMSLAAWLAVRRWKKNYGLLVSSNNI
jgi:hypothetical protein